MTDALVAIHGQSDQHRLLQAGAQRAALDSSLGGDHRSALADYDAAYQRLQEVEAELAEVAASARERAREADLLRFGLGEVEAVSPQPGEDEELRQVEALAPAGDAEASGDRTGHRGGDQEPAGYGCGRTRRAGAGSGCERGCTADGQENETTQQHAHRRPSVPSGTRPSASRIPWSRLNGDGGEPGTQTSISRKDPTPSRVL